MKINDIGVEKRNAILACISTVFIIVFQHIYIYFGRFGSLPIDQNVLKSFCANFVLLGFIDIVLVLFSYSLFLSYIPGLFTCLVITFSDFAIKVLVYVNTGILNNVIVSVVLYLVGCWLFFVARLQPRKKSVLLYAISIVFFIFSSIGQNYVFFFVFFLFSLSVISNCLYQRKQETQQLLSVLFVLCILEVAILNKCILSIIQQCVFGNVKQITFPYLVNVNYCLSFISNDTLHMEWYLDHYVLQILAFFVIIILVLCFFVFALCRKEKWYPKMKAAACFFCQNIKNRFLNLIFDKKNIRTNMFLIYAFALMLTVFCMGRCLDVWKEYGYANECFFFLMPLFILLLAGCIFNLIRRIRWNYDWLQLSVFGGAVICVLIIAKLKFIPQEYDQFIIENLAFLGTNKTNELKVFYVYLLVSLLLALGIGYFCVEKKTRKIICNRSVSLKEKGIDILLLFVFYSLAIYGVVAIINLFYIVPQSAILCIGLAVVMTAISLLSSVMVQAKIITYLQCVIPFSLLVYINSNYFYKQKSIQVFGSPVYYFLIFSIVVLLECLNIRYCVQIWKKSNCNSFKHELSDLVSIYSCFVIAAFAAFPGAELIVIDSHHPGEIIISFMEIFDKGALLYRDYFPVSGLFSVVLGGINELLGGKYSYASQTSSLFCMLVAIGTAGVLCKYMKRSYVAIIAFFITLAMPPYMIRTQLVLPFILILFLPKLKQSYQILLYVMFSLIMVLYYPLYGVAFSIGLLPYEVKVLSSLLVGLKRKTQKMDVGACIFGIILCIICLSCVPLLWKMAKHMLVYSSQSLLADGYTVIGQVVPDDFLPILKSCEGIRKLIFCSLWFFVPVSLLVVCCYWIGGLLRSGIKSDLKNRWFYMLAFLIIFSCISFSYSQMRVETNLLGRTVGVLFPLVPVLLLVICHERNITTYRTFLYGAVMFILIILYDSSLLSNLSGHFISGYKVNDDLVFVNEDIGNMGKGFYEKSICDDCLDLIDIVDHYGDDASYTGLYFAQIYAAGAKTIGQPSMIAMKSKSAIDETIGLFADRDVVVSNKMTPYGQYRWNKYLMTSDAMVYDQERNCFLSQTLAQKKHVRGDDKSLYCYQMENIGEVANVLGRSFDTYGADWLVKGNAEISSGSFTSQTITDETYSLYCKDYSFTIADEVDSKRNDFLYIQLNCDQKSEGNETLEQLLNWNPNNIDIVVDISWKDSKGNDTHICSYLGDGKLLFPLGMNSKWYTSMPETIDISIMSSAKTVDDIEISNLEFYQLDE